MYLATGDRDAADTYSFGLMKSTDGGYTWGPSGLTFNVSNNYRIGRVVVHPDSTGIVIVATNGGIYRSLDYGTNFILEQSGNFYGVHMGHGDTVFATTGGSNAKVYRSLNAGDTWSQLGNGLPTSGTVRCEMAVSNQPGVVYAVFGNSSYGFGGLYRSTNGGSNWTLMSNSPNIMGWQTNGGGTGGQSWYDLSIACDPTNENTLYVGGVNIWKSTNGGANWTIVGHWWGASGTPYVHADHHHAKFKPGTSELYVGTDGGVYKTTNGGSSWTELNNGMNITQYYKISQSTSDTTVVIGGAQDNGSHLRGASSWTEVTGGDGMDNGVDAVNDDIMYTSIYYGDFYKSTNGGAFFSSINTLSPAGSGNWVTPFNVDPVTGNTIYAGFDKLWKSTNGGASWTATSTGSVSGGSNIDEFEIAPSNTNYIYVLINSNIFKSTNGGSTWTTITPAASLNPSPNNISGLDVDDSNADHVVISISGFNGGKKVMETFNGGTTWSNITSGLPNVPANCVTFEGGASDGIYVGTDIGVYYTSSNYPTWVSYNENLPNVIVTDFEIFEDDNTLRIGTMGRGAWQSPMMAGLAAAPVANFQVDPVAICSLSDTTYLYDMSSNLPTSWYWQITPATYTFVGGTSDSSENPKLVFSATGAYTIALTVSNPYGTDDTTMYQIAHVGGVALPFVEDFENGIGQWEIANPDAGITWSTATIGGTLPGNQAMYMNHYSYSTTGQEDALISPAFDFTNDTLVSMTFQYASAYYTGYSDSLKVYVSEDCGLSWTLLSAYNSSDANFTTVGALGSAFVPNDSTHWCHGSTSVNCPTIDLDAYSGQSGIRIKFVSVNGYGNNLYLDNINISGQAQVAPVASFTGDTASCVGKALQFFDFTTPAPASRLWSFQGGTPATSTAANPSVVYSAPGSYDVKLVVQNAAGTDSVVQANFVTIVASPVANVALQVAGTTVCSGDTLHAAAVLTNGGTNPAVDWLLNGVVVASNTLTYSNTYQDGDVLKVRLTSSDDCIASPVVTDSISITVNALPSVSLGSQGYVCELDGPQALSGGLPVGGVYSGNGVVNDSIYPDVAGVGSHWIYYTYTDATTGCARTKQRAISVQGAPGKPTVTQNASSGALEATTPIGTYTYQWLDASMNDIAGATQASYTPLANGMYYVRIFANTLCSNVSDAYNVVNIGLEEGISTKVSIFPNPAHSELQFNLMEEGTVRIMDAAGRVVYDQVVVGTTRLEIGQWARGTYLIQVVFGQEVHTEPLVLQ
jgi:PKD repeat protein